MRHNYFNLKHIVKVLQKSTHGAVFDTITRETLRNCKVTFMGTELAKQYECVVAPMINAMGIRSIETKNLTNLRDTLLPKLIEGEIDMSALLE